MTTSTDMNTKLVLNRLFGIGVVSSTIYNRLNQDLYDKLKDLDKAKLYDMIRDPCITYNYTKQYLKEYIIKHRYDKVVMRYYTLDKYTKNDMSLEIITNISSNWRPSQSTINDVRIVGDRQIDTIQYTYISPSNMFMVDVLWNNKDYILKFYVNEMFIIDDLNNCDISSMEYYYNNKHHFTFQNRYIRFSTITKSRNNIKDMLKILSISKIPFDDEIFKYMFNNNV